MRLLLDTHAFLWTASGDSRLSDRVRSVVSDKRNTLYLSAASSWEIVIKHQAGKLRLPDAPSRFLPLCLQLFALETLAVTISHALQVESLPHHHRDPFDRILIAQSQLENLPILTADRIFGHYAVETFW